MGVLTRLVGRRKGEPDRIAPSSGEGYVPPSQDTLAAIGELSRVVKDNPDAVEIYLALGNLFRSHGEIERAVQIRNNLIVRPGLRTEFKAKALYELGRDFKRAGLLDRAMSSLEEARRLMGDDPAIVLELARISAESGDYEAAVRYYSAQGHHLAQAHYLVRQADSGGPRLLKKALDAYPASPEAHLGLLMAAYANANADKLQDRLHRALAAVHTELRFVLCEGLMRFVHDGVSPLKTSQHPRRGPEPGPALSDAVLPVLEETEPDMLLNYYGGRICRADGSEPEARLWFEKALVIAPEFWGARLELLNLAADDQELAPAFAGQLHYFLDAAGQVKRFVCRVCGLRRPDLFFVCPRCQSWHSIRFRMNLVE
jgi:tetratricopeptide (TPR) repeat protein